MSPDVWSRVRRCGAWFRREHPDAWREWRRVRENSTADTAAFEACVAEWRRLGEPA